MPKTLTTNWNQFGATSPQSTARLSRGSRNCSSSKLAKGTVSMPGSLSTGPRPTAATASRWRTRFPSTPTFSSRTQPSQVSPPPRCTHWPSLPLVFPARILLVAEHNKGIVVHAVPLPGARSEREELRHPDVAHFRLPTRCHWLRVEHSRQPDHAPAEADPMHYNNAHAHPAIHRQVEPIKRRANISSLTTTTTRSCIFHSSISLCCIIILYLASCHPC